MALDNLLLVMNSICICSCMSSSFGFVWIELNAAIELKLLLLANGCFLRVCPVDKSDGLYHLATSKSPERN